MGDGVIDNGLTEFETPITIYEDRKEPNGKVGIESISVSNCGYGNDWTLDVTFTSENGGMLRMRTLPIQKRDGMASVATVLRAFANSLENVWIGRRIGDLE